MDWFTIDRSRIKAGDTVTATRADWVAFGEPRKGYVLTGEVYEINGFLWIGPVSLNSSAITITDWKAKPKPLPLTNGSIVREKREGGHTAVRVAGFWIWLRNGQPTDPSEWTHGWTLERLRGAGTVD